MIYEGQPTDRARLVATISDLIRADPHFTGAGQEAMQLADRILDIPELREALDANARDRRLAAEIRAANASGNPPSRQHPASTSKLDQ